MAEIKMRQLDEAYRGIEMMLKEPSSDRCGTRERRRHTRYPITAAVEAVERQSQTRIQGRTSDLSRGGCYVDTISSFPAGSVVTMRLTKETRSFEVQAEVVYSLTGMGMGVKFVDADPEQLSTVDKWVAEIGAEAPPEMELELELEDPSEPPSAQERPGSEEFDVLRELLLELMKQRVLPDEKCKALLQRLNRTGR
jgi:hypothetical protein